jgi:hypothetical protein
VPPLPVYDPEKYRNMLAMQRITAPPKRVYTLRRKNSWRPLRIVQYDPMRLSDEPNSLNRSASKESLSSVYSRSVSGDSPDPSCRPVPRGSSGQLLNTSTTLTSVGRKPLDGNQPGVGSGILHKPRLHSKLRENFNGQIIDATTDASKEALSGLPSVRAVGTFGDVQDWGTAKGFDAKYARNARISTWTERCNLPPLPVEKLRAGRQ